MRTLRLYIYLRRLGHGRRQAWRRARLLVTLNYTVDDLQAVRRKK